MASTRKIVHSVGPFTEFSGTYVCFQQYGWDSHLGKSSQLGLARLTTRRAERLLKQVPATAEHRLFPLTQNEITNRFLFINNLATKVRAKSQGVV